MKFRKRRNIELMKVLRMLNLLQKLDAFSLDSLANKLEAMDSKLQIFQTMRDICFQIMESNLAKQRLEDHGRRGRCRQSTSYSSDIQPHPCVNL